MDLVISIVDVNKPYINALIKQYEPSAEIHMYKGMRKSLPRDSFPSLELEPVSGNTSWITTETQGASYTIQMTLTVVTDRDDMSAEYICNLTRLFTEIFNNPANMALPIPYEEGYSVNGRAWAQNIVQFSMVESVSYNSNKEGTIRISQWDWTGQVRESFPREYYERGGLAPLGLDPHDLPPPPEWNENI